MNFQIINLEDIHQSMMGNNELINQLVNLYIEQSPKDFEALEIAISSGDKTRIREKAHHIKPTMQYVGAKGLLVDFQHLENLSKEEAPIDEITSHFLDIRPKFMQMIEELKILANNK